MPTKIKLVPITERAALQRINRVLSKTHRNVRTARKGSGQENNCGRHYEIDAYRNMVTDTFINLEKYGRDLKVIADWETVES